MNRPLILLAATAVAALAVSSACFAGPAVDPILFTLQPARSPEKVQLSLTKGRNHNMSNQFARADLSGLEPGVLRLTGSVPVRFAWVRAAGRIDCVGRAAGPRAEGDCRFAADPRFADLLASRGVDRPDAEQSYELALVGASPELVEALHAARYPTPTIDQLTELAAVGVDRRFIDELARRNYRPARLHDLVEFGALKFPRTISTPCRAPASPSSTPSRSSSSRRSMSRPNMSPTWAASAIRG